MPKLKLNIYQSFSVYYCYTANLTERQGILHYVSITRVTALMMNLCLSVTQNNAHIFSILGMCTTVVVLRPS